MTIHIARLRALHICALVALCLLAFGSQAMADDGTTTPARAVPLARALQRTFPSYDALLATAAAVANDQVSLYAQLQLTTAEHDLAKTILATVADPTPFHGHYVIGRRIAEPDPAARDDRLAEALWTESARLVGL